MRIVTLLIIALAACTTHEPPTSPDAGLPIEVDGQGSGEINCCDYAPNADFVRQCAIKTTPPGVCGVVACPDGAGGFDRYNFCH